MPCVVCQCAITIVSFFASYDYPVQPSHADWRGSSLAASAREGVTLARSEVEPVASTGTSRAPTSQVTSRESEYEPAESSIDVDDVPRWTPMHASQAETIMLHCASCKVLIDSSGHAIAVLIDTTLPMSFTLLSLTLAVRVALQTLAFV